MLDKEVLISEENGLEESLGRHSAEGVVITFVLVDRGGQRMNYLILVVKLEMLCLQLLTDESKRLQ